MASPSKSANRPLSPHLQIYRPQLTSMLSISHRLSGIALSGAALLMVYWLVSLAGGEQSYVHAQGVLSSWWSQLILFLFTFAMYFHLANGVRHLYWDTGRGFDMPSVYTSGWAVIVFACVLTVFTWIMAYVVI